jgi:hypothetical protein
MSEEVTEARKRKCPRCNNGQLEIRFLVKEGLPDLHCMNAQCNKHFRAYEKDIANKCYRVYLIDKFGISLGKGMEVEI